MENIAKSTSYGCYLDCDFETAKYPDDKTHIVGLLAEYVYDLEQRILHYDERYIKLWNEIETLRECVSKEFDKEQKISDLEAKLAESEKSKESYRLQNEHHHLQLLQFYSRLGVEAFGADIHEKALETLMIMKEELEEKNGVRRALSACNRQNDEFAEMIKKLANEKEQLKQQLEEKEKENELMAKTLKLTKFVEKEVNQDKISFAIDELEKVKETTECVLDNALKNSSLNQSYYDRLLDEIDNQIEELKKEMK